MYARPPPTYPGLVQGTMPKKPASKAKVKGPGQSAAKAPSPPNGWPMMPPFECDVRASILLKAENAAQTQPGSEPKSSMEAGRSSPRRSCRMSG